MHCLAYTHPQLDPMSAVCEAAHIVRLAFHTTYPQRCCCAAAPIVCLLLSCASRVCSPPLSHAAVLTAEAAAAVDTATAAADEAATTTAPPAATPVYRTIKQLRLRSAAAYLPHPEKESYGGEDAHFVSNISGGAIGVADGACLLLRPGVLVQCAVGSIQTQLIRGQCADTMVSSA